MVRLNPSWKLSALSWCILKSQRILSSAVVYYEKITQTGLNNNNYNNNNIYIVLQKRKQMKKSVHRSTRVYCGRPAYRSARAYCSIRAYQVSFASTAKQTHLALKTIMLHVPCALYCLLEIKSVDCMIIRSAA